MDGMKLFWGLIVLTLGVGLVGVNVGWWDSSIWPIVLTLWPLVIIAFGLRLIIRNEKVLAASLLALYLLAAAFVVTAYTGENKLLTNSQTTGVQNVSGKYDKNSVKKVTLSLETGAAKLVLGTLPEGTADNTLYNVRSENMGRLQIVQKTDGDTVTLSVKEATTGVYMGMGPRMMTGREMMVYLPKSLLIDLNIDGGATKLELDFSDLQLVDADLDIGASTGTMTFGKNTPKQTLTLDAGASNLVFRFPVDVGIKTTFDKGLNTVKVDPALELTKTDTGYITADFDTSTNQITINGSTGVSNIELGVK